MKSRIAAVSFAFLLTLGSSLHAEPSPEVIAEARQRFQRGVELYREGSFDAALAEFNKAYEIAPNYKLLYNMAQVQTERHDYVAALKLLTEYLENGGSEITTERRAQVQQEIVVMRGRVGDLNVKSDVDGAEVVVDGVVVGELPLDEPVLVNSGVRQVQLRKPGYVPKSQNVTVAGGETVSLTLTLEPEPAARPIVTPTPAREPSRPLPAEPVEEEGGGNAGLWVSLASTVVFTGGAVTFGILTRQAERDFENELDRLPGDDERIEDARSSLKLNAALTDGFTAAAAVAAGFTLYFALSGGSSDERTPTANLKVAPSARGVHLLGQF